MVFFENLNLRDFQELNKLQTAQKLNAGVAEVKPEFEPNYTLIEDGAKVAYFESLSEKQFQQQFMANMKYKMFYRSAHLNFQKQSIRGFLFMAQQSKVFENYYCKLKLKE